MKALTVRLVAEWVSGTAEEFLDDAAPPAPSCATCKWAEEDNIIDGPAALNGLLICREHWTHFNGVGVTKDGVAPKVGRSYREESQKLCVDSGGEWAMVRVAPSFGCVSWEGK